MSEESSSPRYNAGREGRAEGRPRAASPVAERPSPHDLEVERAVLSAMLRDPAYCGSKAVELLNMPGAFYSQVHREIFAAYMRLYNASDSGIDVLALSTELKRCNKLDICGGTAALAELENAISSTYNFEPWCIMLRDLATLRNMINVCSDAIRKCYSAEKDAADLVNEIENDIYKAKSKGADVIIACMHWGDEYVKTPPKRVQTMSQWLIEQGVDHIIGNHPHVIQPIEIREDSITPDKHVVAYSTGNLVSNMSLRGTDGGMMIKMRLKKILNYTRVASLEYLLTWIAPKSNNGKRDFTILPAATTKCSEESYAHNRLQQFLNDTKTLFDKYNKGDIREIISDSVDITQ